jgi:hypothetical protein
MLLFRELNFNLTIHNPYRAVEGLLIDIKTRCRTVSQVDTFRHHFFTFNLCSGSGFGSGSCSSAALQMPRKKTKFFYFL